MLCIPISDRSNHKASVDVTVGSDDDDCGDTVSIFSNQSEQHITDGIKLLY